MYLPSAKDEYTLFTYSFSDLIASDVLPITDDEPEKHNVCICMAGTWLRGHYPDLSVTGLNQASIEYLTLTPGDIYHDALDPAPVLPKSWARHQPHWGTIFCHPSSRLARSRRSRVGEKSCFQARFVLRSSLCPVPLCKKLSKITLISRSIRAGDWRQLRGHSFKLFNFVPGQPEKYVSQTQVSPTTRQTRLR